MSKNMIKIPAKAIRGAMACIPQDNFRRHFSGVAFDGDIGKIYATNGHMLFAYKCKDLKGAFEGTNK